MLRGHALKADMVQKVRTDMWNFNYKTAKLTGLKKNFTIKCTRPCKAHWIKRDELKAFTGTLVSNSDCTEAYRLRFTRSCKVVGSPQLAIGQTWRSDR